LGNEIFDAELDPDGILADGVNADNRRRRR
jgi:hypothetical protein